MTPEPGPPGLRPPCPPESLTPAVASRHHGPLWLHPWSCHLRHVILPFLCEGSSGQTGRTAVLSPRACTRQLPNEQLWQGMGWQTLLEPRSSPTAPAKGSPPLLGPLLGQRAPSPPPACAVLAGYLRLLEALLLAPQRLKAHDRPLFGESL